MRTAFYAMLLIVTLVLASCSSGAATTDVSAIEGYDSWTRVNLETITGDETGTLGSNVHEGAAGFREIYVNPIGEPVSLGGEPTPFAVGSILVKESFADGGGQKGELANLTVMIKREEGYDSENGDWEYINLSPDMRVRAQGAIRACYACHAAAAGTDYSFSVRQ